MVLLACLMAAHFALSKVASSPWCLNASAPAQVGMYGDLVVDLVGPKGPSGFYVDVPVNASALFAMALGQLVGFNNREARRGFETAASVEPHCALCFWGVAASLAMNINYHIEDQESLNAAARRAAALASEQPSLSAKSRRLIASVGALIAVPPATGDVHSYAATMCADTLPEADADVGAMCAGATMATSPWHYYNGTASGGHYSLLPSMERARALLAASAFGGDAGTPHALAIHLLIHLDEPSNAPEAARWEAVEAAQALYATHGAALVPAQGHLTHMPAHLATTRDRTSLPFLARALCSQFCSPPALTVPACRSLRRGCAHCPALCRQ